MASATPLASRGHCCHRSYLAHPSLRSACIFPLLEQVESSLPYEQHMALAHCRPIAQAFWGFSSPVAHPLALFFSLVLQEVNSNRLARLCCHASLRLLWHIFCSLCEPHSQGVWRRCSEQVRDVCVWSWLSAESAGRACNENQLRVTEFIINRRTMNHD
jgi:hypothetical protein